MVEKCFFGLLSLVLGCVVPVEAGDKLVGEKHVSLQLKLKQGQAFVVQHQLIEDHKLGGQWQEREQRFSLGLLSVISATDRNLQLKWLLPLDEPRKSIALELALDNNGALRISNLQYLTELARAVQENQVNLPVTSSLARLSEAEVLRNFYIRKFLFLFANNGLSLVPSLAYSLNNEDSPLVEDHSMGIQLKLDVFDDQLDLALVHWDLPSERVDSWRQYAQILRGVSDDSDLGDFTAHTRWEYAVDLKTGMPTSAMTETIIRTEVSDLAVIRCKLTAWPLMFPDPSLPRMVTATEVNDKKRVLQEILGAKGATGGFFKQARQGLSQCLSRYPYLGMEYRARGVVNELMGQLPEADRDFVDAVRFGRADAEPCFQLARRLQEREQLRSALAYLSEAARLAPTKSHYLLERSRLARKLGQYGLALTSVDQALKLDPDDARGYALRGLLNVELGRQKKAERDIARAQLFEKSASHHRRRAEVMAGLGRTEEMEIQLAEAKRLEPDNAATILVSTRLALQAGSPQQTLDQATEMLTQDPTSLGAWRLRLLALLYLGAPNQASKALESLLANGPTTLFLYELALTLKQVEVEAPHRNSVRYLRLQVESALAACEPERWQEARILLMEAKDQRLAGNLSIASSKLEQGLAYHPNLAELHFERYLLLMKQQSPKLAQFALDRCQHIFPYHFKAMLATSNQQMDRGRFRAARAAARHLVSVYPEEHSAWANLAEVLMALGENEEATWNLRRAADLVAGQKRTLYLQEANEQP